MVMALVKVEKGTEFFSRYKKDAPVILQEGILPPLSSQDIIEISGGPGCGKTEALYHFIIRCIMPVTSWKGLNLNGLNTRVIFIDNDLRFNLFRLIKIIEVRLKVFQKKGASITRKEISSFIQTRLELLEIIECSNCDEFRLALRRLEAFQYQKHILMIDGITTFYWSQKMRTLDTHKKLMDYLTLIATMVKNISQKGVITILTKRKLVRFSNCNRFTFPACWHKMVTWHLEVTKPHMTKIITNIDFYNVTAGRKISCVIDAAGLKFCF